jgi:SAM-dependent methyltransferase
MTNSERVFLQYLESAPLSFSLWRALEYQALAGIECAEPVLDLGCGDGLFASLMFPDKRLTGVDITLRVLRWARRSGAHRLVAAADARVLPFRDAAFNTVFSNCVIEHIPGLDKLFAEARRVLAPGGRLIFTVPGERFSRNLFFSRLFNRLGLAPLARLYANGVNHMLKHVHRPTDLEWVAHLQAAGFRVLEQKPLISSIAVLVFDLGNYPGYSAFLTRVIYGRWYVFPAVRRLFAPLLFRLCRPLLRNTRDLGAGLLFVAAVAE